ncbi:MAG: hypothetical protein JRN67_00255 [Nitrososphaerota archaeon]|nr:hypothetical protein [Nitrososphaerota archaeon]
MSHTESRKSSNSSYSKRALAIAAIAAVFLLGSVSLLGVNATGTQVFLFNNNAFSGATNSIEALSPQQSRPWQVLITNDLKYDTVNNQTATFLYYSAGGYMVGGGSGQTFTCTAYTGQTCTWSDFAIYIVGTGALTVIYTQNSSVSSSTATVYSSGTTNVLGAGSTTTTLQQDTLEVDYEGDNTTGSGLVIFYADSPNGQTQTQLFNFTMSGFDVVNYIGVANANSAGQPTAGAGFQQITVTDLPVSVSLNGTFNVIYAVIPLVVVVAVVGWVAKYLNTMKV